MTITFADPSARLSAASPGAAQTSDNNTGERESDFTFDDLIDVINPLHHLPIISTIYRAITGDEISVSARAIGGGLYGGPVGLLAAGATMAVEEAVGMSPDGVLADIFDGENAETTLARNPQAPTPQPSAQAQNAQADTAQMSAIQAALAAPTPAGAPVPNSAAAQPQAQDAAPPSKYADMRFFQLGGERARAANAAAAPAVDESPRGLQTLSPAQNELLQRFVAGAQGDAGSATGLPADGDAAEWFAARMQANLQKYADAQAAGEAAGMRIAR